MKFEKPTYLDRRPIVNGYVVPWFVAWYDADGKQCDERTPGAKPSFPTVDFGKMVQARKRNLCWICGLPMGSNKAFVFGPSSAIMGMSTEPPSHLACAGYAVVTCPFITDPNKAYVGEKKPLKPGERVIDEMSERNPGLAVIWVTKSYEMDNTAGRHPMFKLTGQPVSIQFWKEKRKATYKEVADAMQLAIQNEGKRVKKPEHTREMAFAVYKLMKWAGEPP